MASEPLAERTESAREFDSESDEENQYFSESSEAPRASKDSPLGVIQTAVSAFKARDDLHRLGPSDHLRWASGLPLVDDSARIPTFLSSHFERSASLSVAELHNARQRALAFWRQRKRVTDPHWQTIFKGLPAHCQSVLGPGKNLLL